MKFNIKRELDIFFDQFKKKDNIRIEYFVSEEFPIIKGNVDNIKNIISYALTFIISNMNDGIINVDVNSMRYDKGIGIYLSIMTRDTKIRKEDLKLDYLNRLVEDIDGSILIDNSNKGIIILIDFVMDAIF